MTHHSEAWVSQQTQLVMADERGIPMRNNVGACEDVSGRVIRYGLLNTSKKENDRFKSSDIVGPVPIVIQPHHVGRVMGVMANFETKRSDWRYSPNDARAVAQLRYIELMRSVGCIAGFVTDPAQVKQYIEAFR